MTDHSVYFEIGLFPENTITKEDTLFNNYLCNENQVKYVLEYLNKLYSTSYDKSKCIGEVNYNGNKFNVNIKISPDSDWTTADWFKKEKLNPKAYEILVPNDELKIDIDKSFYHLKFKIFTCLPYLNTWSWDDDGDY